MTLKVSVYQVVGVVVLYKVYVLVVVHVLCYLVFAARP